MHFVMERLTDSFGTARWAEAQDLGREGLFPLGLFDYVKRRLPDVQQQWVRANKQAASFLLGKLADPKELLSSIRQNRESVMESMLSSLGKFFTSHRDEYLAWSGDGHIITIAPTRSGKGVGLVVPNLIHYPGSAIVIDPKGENYAITAHHREEFMNFDVIRLDPFGVMGEGTDYINPLEGLVKGRPETYLDYNPVLLDELASIADAMVIRPGEEKDPHWNDKARMMIKALLLAVLCNMGPNRRHDLGELRAILETERLGAFFKKMMANKTAVRGKLAALGSECNQMGDNEFYSVVSAVMKHTEFLESPLMQRAFGVNNHDGNGYDVRFLKSSGSASVYIIIPPQYLASYSRAIRVWVTCAMNAMTRTPGKTADGCPVLFMLDEMAQLGTLDCLKQAVSLLAGYGMTLWMVWQDLAQIKSLYKDCWSTFLANAKVQQFFGINDHDTAEYVSKMLGKATIPVETVSGTNSSSGKMTEIFNTNTSGTTRTHAEKERELLMPDEVRRLDRETTLLFVQGCPPIVSKRITYFKDQHFSRYASANPYISGFPIKKGASQ